MHSPDTTFTVQNVTAVMEKVPVDSRGQVWFRLLEEDAVWLQLLEKDAVKETFDSHSNDSEVLQTYCDAYTSCKPDSCWEELASCLYQEDKVTALDRTRPFLPPRGEYSLVNLCSVCCIGKNSPPPGIRLFSLLLTFKNFLFYIYTCMSILLYKGTCMHNSP